MHLIRVAIERKSAYAYGQSLGLTLEAVDWGYLMHMQLTALFDKDAPRPFYFEPKEETGRIVVLGYSPQDAKQLREDADMFAEPAVHQSVDWDTFASKPIPSRFKVGQRLGFMTRICPTEGRAGERRGGEIDVFARRVRDRIRSGDSRYVTRWEAYRDWLAPKMAYNNAATLESMRLTKFCVNRFVRRGEAQEGCASSKRPVHILQRPDAILQGDLTVNDPVSFNNLLVQGLGRHKGFGFGTVLLTRASGI